MKSHLKWAAGLLAATGLAACGGSAGTPSTSVRVAASANAITLVANADFYASVACDGGYRADNLKLVQGISSEKLFEAVFSAVPVDKKCTFSGHADEKRAGGMVVKYDASLEKNFARGDKNPTVILVLQQTTSNGTTTFNDGAPQVVGLTASNNTTDMLDGFTWPFPDLREQIMSQMDALVVLNAALSDADGDTLHYRWNDGGLNGKFFTLDWDFMILAVAWNLPGIDGDFNDLAKGKVPTTVWVPPAGLQGVATLTLTVKDTHAGSGPDAKSADSYSQLGVQVTVDDSNAKKVIHLSGNLNHFPDVYTLVSALDANSVGGQMIPGQLAKLDATIHDFDGDALHYAFTDDCNGAFFKSATGAPMTFPQDAPALSSSSKTAVFSVYYRPAVGPGVCHVRLDLDDLRADPNGASLPKIGGHTYSTISLNVVKNAPVAFGPEITLAFATAGSLGAGDTVSFDVDAKSLYKLADGVTPDPLDYRIQILSPFLDPESAGTFNGPTDNASGKFSWTAPPGGFFGGKCLLTELGNLSDRFYFMVTVTDAPAISNGVPAVNYVVIPIDVDCRK